MKVGKWAAAIVAVAVVLGGGYLILAGRNGGPDAKTLVYCSEGNPEGFNASLFTSGTTFDASSRQIYSRLVEFEHGSTNLIPGLAESWDVAAAGCMTGYIHRPSFSLTFPRARVMLSPGKNRARANLPRVIINLGSMSSICRFRYLEQADISAGKGSLF